MTNSDIVNLAVAMLFIGLCDGLFFGQCLMRFK
ncbi:MAG: hypothetical protein H6Q76_2460 [Firmicutes bacterium]|nr:hypothetical protein [Bacillota bacterium]